MKLKAELLVYLDKRFILQDMLSQCKSYLEELRDELVIKFPPFRFVKEIDVMDLLDWNPDLGEFLLAEPIKFQRVCKEILYACLQTVNTGNKTVQSDQVAVNLRLKCVPRPLVRSNPRNYGGISIFSGLLLSISKPESYVYHTVWSCPEECDENESIVQYIPKFPPRCYVCKSVQFENSGFRRCGEQVNATFKVGNRLLPKNFLIMDDLINKLKLGFNYNIYAITFRKITVVWNLEENICLRPPKSTSVPHDIKNLYTACKAIPWQFIYCLASSIGVGVCPLHCFMNLKIYLLLSLASVRANAQTGSAVVHVLAAGYDTGYVARLMERAAQLSNRSIFFGTANTTVPCALLGSSGGVCVLPLPLHVYKQKQTSAILSALESGEITTETNRLKLRCAVWAHGMDLKKLALQNIACVFGTICRADYGEYNDEIVEFVLENARDPPGIDKEEVQALQEVVTYIDLIAGVDVTLEKRTEKLLRDYFLSARRERPRGVIVGSMNSLVAICVTSARLCRRTTANIDDAVFAIWLHVCGSPEPRFAPEEYLQTPADVKLLQKNMESFKVWLGEFTGCDIKTK